MRSALLRARGGDMHIILAFAVILSGLAAYIYRRESRRNQA